jgi:hypothetical protein
MSRTLTYLSHTTYNQALPFTVFLLHLIVCHGFLILSMFACTAIKLLRSATIISAQLLHDYISQKYMFLNHYKEGGSFHMCGITIVTKKLCTLTEICLYNVVYGRLSTPCAAICSFSPIEPTFLCTLYC